MSHMTPRGVCACDTETVGRRNTRNWKARGLSPQPASQEGTAGAERMRRAEWAVGPLWSGCLGMPKTSGLPSFLSNIWRPS